MSKLLQQCAILLRTVGLIGILLLPLQLAAQTTTGSIYGSVTDSTGAIIPKASVVVTNVDTGTSHTTTSNNSGEYVFQALDPGNYSVSSTVAGFKSETQQGIVLSSNQNVHTNFALTAGSVDQTVTISADTTLVDTRESQLAETVDQRRLEELPLNGRNVYDFVTLVPGVTNYSADSVIGSRTGVSFSVNGLPTNTVSYYLDGTSDTAFYQNGGNIMPNPDALQEFRILTSNFDAEFGRSPGGVVNAITRSGTKDFHGMAYEYLRNNIFNAKSYFATSVTPLKQNQFGGNFGGPLLPHGRAFFFGSFEQLLVHTPAIVTGKAITTATALERTGDFSASPAAVKTQLGGLSCNGVKYVICPNLLDPVAQKLLTFVPVEDPSDTFTTQQNGNGNSTARQYLGRIDSQLTAKHQMEGLFFNARGKNTTPNIGANRILSYAGMVNSENVVNTALVDTWTLSPRTLNNLRGFYSQNRYIIGDIYPDHLLPSLGSMAVEGNALSANPLFTINGYWAMGTNQNGPSDISQLSFGLLDTGNLTRGHHQIKLGGSYVWNKYAETGGLQSNGIFTFTGAQTATAGLAGATGNALADFLEGKAATLVQTTGVIHRSHNYDPSLYAQDDWQATQRLNLNLGVRWEVIAPFVGDPNDGTFKANTQSTIFPSAPLGLIYPGDPGVPQGVYNTSYTHLAPRVGFAYDVFGTGHTSLRGGVGIFYTEPKESDTGGLQQQPYNLSVTVNKTPNLVTPYAPGADPFPFTFNPAAPKFVSGSTTTAARADGGATAYVEEYNLTLEQQLGNQWAMHVSYVGNAARKIALSHDINAPVYAPGAANTTAGINARRPYEPSPSTFVFGAINLNDPANNFSYNSLQATIKGKMGKRFDFQANYVWAKALSYEGPVVSGNNIRLDYGPASTDVRQNFAASYLYRFPEVKAWGMFGREVISGWQINGVTTLQSGSPFTVISGADTNLDGTTNDRADIIGNPYLGKGRSRQQKISQFLNPAAFAVPTGPFGSEQNNSLFGPGKVNTNLSAFKIFPIFHEYRLQFRGEVFNAIGNVNLGNPVASLVTLKTDLSSGASQISSSGSPRIVQFALKFLF